MTHVWGPAIEEEFARIERLDNPGSFEVWLIIDAKTPGAMDIAKRYEHCHIFSVNELFRRLPYPWLKEGTLYSQSHFPILDFYLSHREYNYYWVIEFDVRYTGDWGSLLNSYGAFDHDLIACHIRQINDEPDWWWWDSFGHPAKTIDWTGYLRSINVIYRISNRALLLVNDAQQDGWRGHPEVLIPTLLHHNGCKLLDFGGDGKFTLPDLRNTFYTSGSTRDGVPSPFGTYRWKPSRAKAGMCRNKMYHPVKPRSMMEQPVERVRFFVRWSWKYVCEYLKRQR
ncbi:MAG: DUF3405 domain-containing protein [Methanoregula sp.]|nr:DUF3405 domain-containing protein [Methanoregula sp.]